MIENDYFAWYHVPPNKFGIYYCLHDKTPDQWFFVHATEIRFPAKRIGDLITGILEFYV